MWQHRSRLINLTLISYYIALIIVWWRYYGSSYTISGLVIDIHGLVYVLVLLAHSGRNRLPVDRVSQYLLRSVFYTLCWATFFVLFCFYLFLFWISFVVEMIAARVPIGMRKLPVYVLCVLGCSLMSELLLLLWLLRSCGHKSWRRSTGIFPRWMDIEPLVSRLFVRQSITAHTHTPVAFHSTFYIRKKRFG